jgi:MFS family permease
MSNFLSWLLPPGASTFVGEIDWLYDTILVITGVAFVLVEATLLWWCTWSGRITYPLLVALALFGGLCSAVEIPARQAMMVDLVGREDLREAIALNSSGFNLARIVGPAIGALVIRSFGLAWCFAANALSFVAVLVGLFLIRLPPWAAMAPVRSPMEGIREGLAYIRGTREVFALIQLVAVFSVLGIPYLSLMPVVARDLLGMGASGYGLLLTSVGVGGLTGALTLAAVAQRVRRGRLLMLSSTAYALLLVAFSLVRTPSLAYPVLLCTGFTMILNGALSNALLQHLVPDELRGRLMAVYSLIVVGAAQVFGAFAAGAIARAVGVDWAIGGGAAIMLGYVLWAQVRYPEVAEL